MKICLWCKKLCGCLLLLFLAHATSLAQQQMLEQRVPDCETPLKLRLLPGGSFMMGNEADGKKEVTLSSFYISIYETTWEQYNTFFADAGYSANNLTDAVTRPSPPYIDFTLGMGKEGFPANSMQQFGAIMFCKWLYDRTGEFYRLPTEAEWEYAARAGTNSLWPHGDDTTHLAEYAWYAANSTIKYQKPGTLKPNAWGIYDMMGNVAEWVLDQYAVDYFNQIGDGAKDPMIKPTKRIPRSVRGGSYRDDAAALQPGRRSMADMVWNRRDPQIPKSKWWNTDAPFVGFRVVKPLKQPSAQAIEQFFNTFLIR